MNLRGATNAHGKISTRNRIYSPPGLQLNLDRPEIEHGPLLEKSTSLRLSQVRLFFIYRPNPLCSMSPPLILNSEFCSHGICVTHLILRLLTSLSLESSKDLGCFLGGGNQMLKRYYNILRALSGRMAWFSWEV